jgi:hypothetical protein
VKHWCLLLAVCAFLCAGLPLGIASDAQEKTANMQLIQIMGEDEFVTDVLVKIGDGNRMTIEMPGRESIIVDFSRRTGGIIKFAVSEIEMGKLRTMHFIGTGFQDGKLVGKIVFIEDGKLQEDVSGRFLLDDVFEW